MAQLIGLEYISKLTARELFDYWKESFRIDKNNNSRSSVRKVWLFFIAKHYTDIAISELATVFDTTEDSINRNIYEFSSRRTKTATIIEDLLSSLNFWKYCKTDRVYLTIQQYQDDALSTAIYGKGHKIIYPTLGLAGEAGEVADKIKKVLRDKRGRFSEKEREEIAKELGDVLWYLSALSRDLGYTLEEVAKMNIEKLFKRRVENKIQGSGDNR